MKISISKKVIILASSLTLLLVFLITLLEITNVTHFFHTKTKTAPTANEYTKGEPKNKSGSTSNNKTTTNNNQTVDTSKKGSESTYNLIAPIGDFVSNHHPNLVGSPSPNLISSVCTTTPGASCQINFTKGGITKSLYAQTTDEGGSAYWDWKLQDIGITTGSWSIEATASLNGQIKSTKDTSNLEVSP